MVKTTLFLQWAKLKKDQNLAALASQVSVRSEFINRKKQTKNGMALHGMVKNKTKLKKNPTRIKNTRRGKEAKWTPKDQGRGDEDYLNTWAGEHS